MQIYLSHLRDLSGLVQKASVCEMDHILDVLFSLCFTGIVVIEELVCSVSADMTHC